jgi:hypothetical protein
MEPVLRPTAPTAPAPGSSSLQPTDPVSPSASHNVADLLALFRPGLHVAEDLLQTFENMLLTCKRQLERAQALAKARLKRYNERREAGYTTGGSSNGKSSDDVHCLSVAALSIFSITDFKLMGRSAVATYLDDSQYAIIRVAAALCEVRAHLARLKEQIRALPRASGSRKRKPVVESSDVESDERRGEDSDSPRKRGKVNEDRMEDLKRVAGQFHGNLKRLENDMQVGFARSGSVAEHSPQGKPTKGKRRKRN